ncbi:MAG: hypothetical protein RSB37_10395, partial [Acetivibrio sp.]
MRKYIKKLMILCCTFLLVPLLAHGEDERKIIFQNGNPVSTYVEGGTIWVADTYNKAIWNNKSGKFKKMNKTSAIIDEHGEPMGDYVDGKIREALFSTPYAMAPYRKGMAISDSKNNTVRYVKDNMAYTVKSLKNNMGELSNPTGLASDEKGNLYVSDTNHHVIKKIDNQGKITIFAGGKKGCKDGTLKEARFFEPMGLFYKEGILYIADSGNHRICKIINGKVMTIAGGVKKFPTKEGGNQDGDIKTAKFYNPQSIVVNRDNCIIICDTGNATIRKIDGKKVTTLPSLSMRPKTISLLTDSQVLVCDNFQRIAY